MLLSNGFLITDIPQIHNNIQYFGIENNAWPLKNELLSEVWDSKQLEQFEDYLNDLTVNEHSIGLVDFQLAKEYKRACDIYHQSCRMLYVEIKRKLPLNMAWHDQFAVENSFLGFDVGICAFDYYSSLLADIIGRPGLLNKDIYTSLNERGLFDFLDDVYFYLEQRELFKKKYSQFTFENGEMSIIALYQLQSN